MKKVEISPYIAFLANGSDISNPDADSGYEAGLVAELARVGTKGGTISLTPPELLDLAEWLDAIGSAEGQGGNTSGARSCERLAEKARALA